MGHQKCPDFSVILSSTSKLMRYKGMHRLELNRIQPLVEAGMVELEGIVEGFKEWVCLGILAPKCDLQ